MNREPTLRPQDVVLVLKLLATPKENWTYSEIGEELDVSASQAYSSVQRAATSGLLHFASLQSMLNRANIKEFLIHGVKYSFPTYRGTLTRGVPTSFAAPPLNRMIQTSADPPPVWPDPNGTIRGAELSPLYKNVPKAAQRDAKLYELLALLDAIRDGRARERELAIRELSSRVDSN